MRNIFVKILFLVLLLTSCELIFSQNSDTLRNAEFRNIADTILAEIAPDYNRHYKTAAVEYFIVECGIDKGKEMCCVIYPYDKSVELLSYNYSAKVYIYTQTKEVYRVSLGSGINIEVLQAKRAGRKIKKIEFQTVPPPVQVVF